MYDYQYYKIDKLAQDEGKADNLTKNNIFYCFKTFT